MHTQKTTLRRLPPAIALLVLLMLLVSSCVTRAPGGPATRPPLPTPDPTPTSLPGEIALAFESVDQGSGNAGASTFGAYPAVVLAASPEQIAERITPLVPGLGLVPAFQKIDFDEEFVVAVFQGSFGEGCCHVTVRRVARHGDQILIYAELSEAAPSSPVQPASSFPYHVVQVRRDGGPPDPPNVVLVTWKVYR